MKIFLIILAIFLTSCKLNKVVNHHGIHNLEAKKPSGKGIAAKDFESVIGKKLIKNIKRGQFIKRGDIS